MHYPKISTIQSDASIILVTLPTMCSTHFCKKISNAVYDFVAFRQRRMALESFATYKLHVDMSSRVCTFFTFLFDHLLYMIFRGQIDPKHQCKNFFFQNFVVLILCWGDKDFLGGRKSNFLLSRKA